LNKKRLASIENLGVWGKMENVIKLLGKTMNKSFKCHLHIRQPMKGVYVMNIIVQGILEGNKMRRKKIPREHPKC
jgi:hypothetical protein